MTQEELEQDFRLFIMELSKKYSVPEEDVLKALLGVTEKVVNDNSSRNH